MKSARNKAQIIAPDAYPQMLSKPNAARALKTLRAGETAERAKIAMEAQVPAMRAAILEYVEALEQAGTDMRIVFERSHDIRGFAETAGLVTTGRIADILCRYIDDMERIKKPLDATLVALNVSVIGRAARAEGSDTTMGDTVAQELAALVAKRLADASQG